MWDKFSKACFLISKIKRVSQFHLGPFSYHTPWTYTFLLSLSIKFNILQESISSPSECCFILYILNLCLHLMVSVFLSPYFSFILRVSKGSIFSNFPKEWEESLIFGSLPLRTCSPMPAVSTLCAQLLPVTVNKVSTGESPLSDGRIKMTFLMLKADLDTGLQGLRLFNTDWIRKCHTKQLQTQTHRGA